jgi:hypothetical protein
MKGRIGIETALAALFMVLIVLFVVWYAYLMVQIQRIGWQDTAVSAMPGPAEATSTSTAPTTRPAMPMGTAPSRAAAPTSAASATTPPSEEGGGKKGPKRIGGGMGLGGKGAGDAGTDSF